MATHVKAEFYSAVFFDMDGLFVNSEPLWLEAETELMAKHGVQWTLDDQAHCIGGPLSKVGGYMSQLALGVESQEYFTEAVIEQVRTKMTQGTPLMPGAIELTRDLHANGVSIALVSASPRVLVDAVLNNIPEHFFSFSISSSEVSMPKPDPEAYVKAAHDSGVNISDCLIFEDSLTGVTAAKASGAHVIAIPHIVRVEASERVHVGKSLEEFSFNSLQTRFSRHV
ncbi:unannotated protein [freshwater metagenome]|uniref:Unannotated protein n=1 Tax=freshwater metagenome TaxID=449393 RepID=A0A6J7XVF5_9ZZZZ|nr:HAD-IA family hydrolase [Actinomycetota bacterium]